MLPDRLRARSRAPAMHSGVVRRCPHAQRQACMQETKVRGQALWKRPMGHRRGRRGRCHTRQHAPPRHPRSARDGVGAVAGGRASSHHAHVVGRSAASRRGACQRGHPAQGVRYRRRLHAPRARAALSCTAGASHATVLWRAPAAAPRGHGRQRRAGGRRLGAPPSQAGGRAQHEATKARPGSCAQASGRHRARAMAAARARAQFAAATRHAPRARHPRRCPTRSTATKQEAEPRAGARGDGSADRRSRASRAASARLRGARAHSEAHSAARQWRRAAHDRARCGREARRPARGGGRGGARDASDHPAGTTRRRGVHDGHSRRLPARARANGSHARGRRSGHAMVADRGAAQRRVAPEPTRRRGSTLSLRPAAAADGSRGRRVRTGGRPRRRAARGTPRGVSHNCGRFRRKRPAQRRGAAAPAAAAAARGGTHRRPRR